MDSTGTRCAHSHSPPASEPCSIRLLGRGDDGRVTAAPAPVRGRARLLTACFLALGVGMIAMASLQGMLVPLQATWVLSVDRINALTLIVSAGSLLVLFAAGEVVDRLGSRRVLLTGAAASTLGALLVAAAPAFAWLFVGRVIGGIGGTLMAVSALALINETVIEDRQRAYVFGLFGAYVGLIFAVAPIFGGVVSDRLSWRLVPLAWIALSIAAALLVPRGPRASVRSEGELVTPLAAGAVLSAVCVAALSVQESLALSASALALALIAAAVLIVRWTRLRRSGRTPGLDVSVFSAPGAKPLMGAMLTVAAVNLYFFWSLYLQYRLRMSSTETAALLVIPQVAGIVGGLAGGWVSAQWGSSRTTAAALALGCAAALAFLLVTEDSGAWPLVALLALYSFPAGCIVGTLTKAFLDCAEPSASGAASSWRQAGWSLGSTLGGIASGAIVLTFFSSTWTSSLTAAGVDDATARWAADMIRGGASLAQVASSPVLDGVAARSAVESFVGLGFAQVSALHMVAILAAAAYASSLAFVLVAMRRQRAAT